MKLKGEKILVTGGAGFIGSHLCDRFVALGARILVLGITFKPNCPDIRNSKVGDLINYLLGQCASVTAADPWANSKEVQAHYGLELLNLQTVVEQSYDCCVYAVRHDVFEGIEINSKIDYRL